MKLKFIFETIGRTRSEKTVIRAIRSNDVDNVIEYMRVEQYFSPDDFLDAYALFTYLTLRAERKNIPSDVLEDHVGVIFETFEDGQFEQAKERAGIITAFDFQNHALSLVNLEFIDM